MREARAAPRDRRGGDSNVALFLALYLLLLAFFILLNSLSQLEKVKSRAVIDSVTATFAPSRVSGRAAAPPASDAGDILAIEQAQRAIGEAVRALVPAARVEVSVPGRLMEMVLPADSLFVEGAVTVRSGRLPLLDRFVAALAALPPGYVAALDVFLTVPAADRSFPVTQTAEAARAGALARALLARGMAERHLAVGLERGVPGEVRMQVHMLADDAGPGGPRGGR